MTNKRILVIIFSLIIILFIGLGIYWLYFLPKDYEYQNNTKRVGNACLGDDEIVDYSAPGKDQKQQEANKGYFATSPATIYIKDKITGIDKYSFQITNNSEGLFTLQLFKCNIYVVRMFNYDPKKTKQDIGYKEELWKYDYSGRGESLFLLAEKPKEFISYYSSTFRIDPSEKYLVLEKGYLGKEDYSLIVKDLNTKKDVFILSAKSIFEQYPNIIGDFDILEWSKDGRYFWGNISETAYVNGFFRIDAQNWKADIFESPRDVLGGDALNVENGWITVHPGNVWYGFADMTEEEKEKRRKQGIGTELYIQNLITGERKFVVKTDEPLWYFKPKWISDAELQYKLLTGETKIYEIEQK